jgi:ankyrin repeat protein
MVCSFVHTRIKRLLWINAVITTSTGFTSTVAGLTTPHRASRRGHVGLARLLIKYGADVAAQTKDGETLLHRASEGGYVELARLPIEAHGANAAVQTKDEETPLHRASKGVHVGLARLLLKHNADAATQIKDGERHCCIGHPEGVTWSLHGSSNTEPIRQLMLYR